MDDGELMQLALHSNDLLTYCLVDWVLDRTLRVVDRLRDRGELDVAIMADLADLV
ncbi:MAG: hypothetical protein RI568_15720 [Natronomonas sp.]|uniref:hypothetical protein n=1 Tax=Natronomonas sp. TaxID=2184060 RepID=UPI00287099B4|nr:hypothetical protein [Natronomonas sp.]MDR9432129.1 hypothetical protein [Natronomonas sp.]